MKTHTNRLIDLLVYVPSQQQVLVIESKFHFSAPRYTILPIFLTFANEEPSKDNYLLLGYEEGSTGNHRAEHPEFNKQTTGDTIHVFLLFYIQVLKEQLVHDEEAVQLALEIYEGNKSSIDYLYLSQNENFKKQVIYKQIGEFSHREKTALRKIYELPKKDD